MDGHQSWGGIPRAERQSVHPILWQTEALPTGQGLMLPQGLRRSYGDSCLNEGGTLLTTLGLDRLLGFDAATGVVRCEAGVSLDTLLRLAVPRGWFLPVTPGTKFVTVGGAIANDVHGKNHHQAGTFGRYVRRFELLRSDGTRRVCSPEEHRDWYEATIGGLGLTGLILWAEVQLRPIHNPFILKETVPLAHLEDFLTLSQDSEQDYEFTVAWLDSLARGRKLGRGLFFRGNFAPPQFEHLPQTTSHLNRDPWLSVPFTLPSFTLNRLSVAAFNWFYGWVNRRLAGPRLQHYEPFFYPLDSVPGWNRIYGRAGFFQFQCVVPFDTARDALRVMLERSVSEVPCFLNVIKKFGSVKSPGWLSFPRPGVTLALDFAHKGERTLKLLSDLDNLTRQAGGAVYPAKDARMEADNFATYYPQLERFKAYVDPAFSSSFWRRMTGG